MAERISVIVYEKDPCGNCPGNPMTDCQVCEKDLRYDGGMPRQEAIKKMAKAMMLYKLDTSDDYLFNWGALAEAALNALLEEKRG